MKGDLQTTQVAEAEDIESDASEASAQPSADAGDISQQARDQMNALIRGEVLRVVDPAASSNPDELGEGYDAEAQAGASADGAQPSSAVKPAGQAGVGRRGAAAEIERLRAENTALEARVAELVPTPPDASEEARKAILENEAKYRRLTAKPDDDPDWTTEDYQWIQNEKHKRTVAPELRQHYETVLDAEIASLSRQLEDRTASFWTAVTADMATAADLPGVDLAALKGTRTFADRDRMVYSAAKAQADAETRRLREENDDLKRQLLGTVRAPITGGRSAPGQVMDENSMMNNLIRGARNGR